MASSSKLRNEKKSKEKELKKVKDKITNVKSLIKNVDSFSDYINDNNNNITYTADYMNYAVSNRDIVAETIKADKELHSNSDAKLSGLKSKFDNGIKALNETKKELEDDIADLNRRIKAAEKAEREERVKKLLGK